MSRAGGGPGTSESTRLSGAGPPVLDLRLPGVGWTVRAWRERSLPQQFGLLEGSRRRRTPGLRREELAELAGVSPEYLQRIEQDRARPGADVVRALARALRVTDADVDLLLRLAGHVPFTGRRLPRDVDEVTLRLVSSLGPVPVVVYDASWTRITANRSWELVFGQVGNRTGRDRNVVWRHFTGAEGALVPEDPDRHENFLVEELRRAVLRYPGDAELRAMVRDLVGLSVDFSRRWASPSPATTPGLSGSVSSAELGALSMRWDVVTTYGHDLRVVFFTLDDTASRTVVRLLEDQEVGELAC